MKSFIVKYAFPLYSAIVLLDLNEFLTKYLGLEGAITYLLFVLSILLIFSSKPIKGKRSALNDSFLRAFIGFLVLGSFAAWVEGNLDGISKNIRYYLPSLLIYFAVYRVICSTRGYNELQRTIDFALFFISVNAVLIIVSILFNMDFHGSSEAEKVERAVGLYSNANRAGYVSTLGQSLALCSLLSKGLERRYYYMVLYLICFFAALSSFSKGAIILSFIIMIRTLILGLINNNIAKKHSFGLYIRVTAYIFVTVFFIMAFSFVDFSSIFTAEQSQRIDQVKMLLMGQINEETTTHRSELALYALEEMSETFFLGAGLGKFKLMEVGNGSHNVYLLILGEAGVMSLLLYVIFLWKWGKQSYLRRLKDSIQFTSGNILLTILFSGFAAHTVLANKSYMFCLALILGAMKFRFTSGNFSKKY